MLQAYLLFCVLAGTLALFIWGRWRYDVVAFVALIFLTLIGIISPHETFSGFSNPAVVTVACVMVITYVITQSGIVNTAVKHITPFTTSMTLHIGILATITTGLSAFMNNIGALALMMPIAIQTAAQHRRSPALFLMPIAFGSMLGGLTTAIGTPPNLLISAYREQITGHQYAMFDFTPVGVIVAIIGLLFIIFLGWRLLPSERKGQSATGELYQIQDYISEVSIPEDSPIVGKSRAEVEKMIDVEFTILGLIRGKRKRLALPAHEVLEKEDILIIEAAHDDLQTLLQKAKLTIIGGEDISTELLRGEDIGLIEAVIPPSARVEGRSWQQMRIRSRFRMNLLAISRQGKAFKERLNHVSLRAGDVVLLQGDDTSLRENTVNLGLLPLAERGLQIGKQHTAFAPLAIFLAAIILAGLQIFPVQITFATAVLVMVLFNLVPIRQVYANIDWSIIILLAAMIPVGEALQTTGGTELIANGVLQLTGSLSPILILAILMICTMTLSDIMNNAATAVVMAPIAVTIAQTMNASIDPFLMTVAIGASCSFLTPIGHQNNTLVLGPGGYKFSDYFRLGLPIEIIVLFVSLPTILWIWPI